MPDGFQVNITLDDEKFEAALIDWNKTVRLENGIGAVDAAETLKAHIQDLLSRYPHPTGTPSPTKRFIGPPGFISGHLHDSVEVTVKAIPGFTTVGVNAVYARIQEMGGFCGTRHLTYCPPRPYFRSSVMDMSEGIDGGAIGHIFYEHWRASMLEAVKGILF